MRAGCGWKNSPEPGNTSSGIALTQPEDGMLRLAGTLALSTVVFIAGALLPDRTVAPAQSPSPGLVWTDTTRA